MAFATGVQPSMNSTWTTFARMSINNDHPPRINFGMLCFASELVASTKWLSFVYDKQTFGADEHEVSHAFSWSSGSSGVQQPVAAGVTTVVRWTDQTWAWARSWSSGECFLGSLAVTEGELEQDNQRTSLFAIERNSSTSSDWQFNFKLGHLENTDETIYAGHVCLSSLISKLVKVERRFAVTCGAVGTRLLIDGGSVPSSSHTCIAAGHSITTDLLEDGRKTAAYVLFLLSIVFIICFFCSVHKKIWFGILLHLLTMVIGM